MNYILADNQELTRFAVESLIRQDENNQVRKVSDKASLVQALKEQERSVVVLDFTLSDIADEEQLLIIGERFLMAQWVLLSDDLTPGFLRRVVYASHQFSIVFKDGSLKELRDALRQASAGQRFVCQRAMEIILSQQQEEERLEVLTSTEKEIAIAIAKGLTTKEISKERFSSVHTITTHRKNIFRKLGVNTAHEVVKYALRAGWVDPSEFYI